MARTQLKNNLLKNRDLTGASFIKELGIYDETYSYSKNSIVTWKGQKYIAVNAIVSSTLEGDLSNAPDVSSDWELLKAPIYSVYPSVSDSIGTSRTDITFDTERYISLAGTFTVSSGEITFNVNGTYLISCTVSYNNSSSTRNTITTYLQIDTGSGYTDIANLNLFNYSRESSNGKDTSSITIPLDVNTGDKIKLQAVSAVSGVASTVPAGCNVTIFGILETSGPQGEIGPAGPSGDLKWKGTYDSVTSYVTYDTVQYQGSTFVSTGNTTGTDPGDPDAPNSPWELVSRKGYDGSGTQINVSDSGTNIPNTPHGTLNFTGDITATDAGSGVADINVTFPKNTYMIPIWAEENASLANNTYEWAFGNGANTPSGHGVTIYVPSGYICEIVAMSLTLKQGSARVAVEIDGTNLDSTVYVESSTVTAVNEVTPYEVTSGQVLNFKTTTASGTAGPNVVTAYLRYTEK